MLPLSALSRRALVAAGLLAAAPSAVANKQDKKKKRPPQPPLAFGALRVTDVVAGNDASTYRWNYVAELRHPPSGIAVRVGATVLVPIETTEPQTRAAIAADFRAESASFLQGQGQDVPAQRIAVVLL